MNLEHEINLILLLQIIRVNGSVESLIKVGYSYAQVAEEMVQLRQKNIIKGIGDNISLTKEGEILLHTLDKKIHRKGLSKWISPKLDQKIEPIGIYDIYLPNKKTKLG